jgi:hypothetical protein
VPDDRVLDAEGQRERSEDDPRGHGTQRQQCSGEREGSEDDLQGECAAQELAAVRRRPGDEEAAHRRADQERDEGDDGAPQREARSPGEREADEDDVARHVGDEDPTEREDAHRVDHARPHRHQQQDGRQRPVLRVVGVGAERAADHHLSATSVVCASSSHIPSV